MTAKKTNTVERELLKRVEASGGKDREALYDLAKMHEMSGRPVEAIACIERLLPLAVNSEESAFLLMTAGQLSEQQGDYTAAERYYRCGQGLDPAEPRTRYFVHNNLGYCLNQLGRFAEAKEFLLQAIRTDPKRPNGYKNLGLCYVGLGLLVNAAEMFVLATKANAADARALVHLETLVAEHGELLATAPGLQAKLDGCRQAVQKVRELQPRFN